MALGVGADEKTYSNSLSAIRPVPTNLDSVAVYRGLVSQIYSRGCRCLISDSGLVT
jgi:hypothetical protein